MVGFHHPLRILLRTATFLHGGLLCCASSDFPWELTASRRKAGLLIPSRKQARTATSATDNTRSRAPVASCSPCSKYGRARPRQAAQARCGISRLAVGVYRVGPGVARVISSTYI